MNKMAAFPRSAGKSGRNWRNWLVRQARRWHWISAALSLAAILFFAVTGITLNHAESIPATPIVTERQGDLPASALRALPDTAAEDAPLPPTVARAVRDAIGLDPAGAAAEWSADEVYIALPRPGGDAWVSIDRATGKVTAEVTDRGWISWANDLHKGRNSGIIWSWFIDIFAVACVIFTLSGLVLLWVHARYRPSTWTVAAAGIVIPAILLFLFVH